MRQWIGRGSKAGGLLLAVFMAALTVHGFAGGGTPALGSDDAALAPSMAADWGECSSCHSDVAEAFANTLHGKRAFGNLSDVGCQACHGSVERHLENPTDEANQRRITDLGPRVVSDT